MDREWYQHRIKRCEKYLDWLHSQALSGLPWEIITEILETKAIYSVQLRAYRSELALIGVDIKKKGESDGVNDHCNS